MFNEEQLEIRNIYDLYKNTIFVICQSVYTEDIQTNTDSVKDIFTKISELFKEYTIKKLKIKEPQDFDDINKHLNFIYNGSIDLHTTQIKNYLEKENAQSNKSIDNNINVINSQDEKNNIKINKDLDLNELSNKDKQYINNLLKDEIENDIQNDNKIENDILVNNNNSLYDNEVIDKNKIYRKVLYVFKYNTKEDLINNFNIIKNKIGNIKDYIGIRRIEFNINVYYIYIRFSKQTYYQPFYMKGILCNTSYITEETIKKQFDNNTEKILKKN